MLPAGDRKGQHRSQGVAVAFYIQAITGPSDCSGYTRSPGESGCPDMFMPATAFLRPVLLPWSSQVTMQNNFTCSRTGCCRTFRTKPKEHTPSLPAVAKAYSVLAVGDRLIVSCDLFLSTLERRQQRFSDLTDPPLAFKWKL